MLPPSSDVSLQRGGQMEGRKARSSFHEVLFSRRANSRLPASLQGLTIVSRCPVNVGALVFSVSLHGHWDEGESPPLKKKKGQCSRCSS